MLISGKTKYYAQLADPVAHVRFPGIFQEVLDGESRDVAVVPMHVAAADLTVVVDALRVWQNLIGVGVTMPHKEKIVELLDATSRQSSLVGAANAVRREPDGRLIGTMVDGLGFVKGLRDLGADPEGMDALLVGAGGTARAIAFALAEAGVASLGIANRTPARAESLAEEVGAAFPGCTVDRAPAVPDGQRLIVNATSLGMRADDPLPVDVRMLGPETIVADVVTVPAETEFLLAAREQGCTTLPGRAMLDAQIPLILEFLELDRLLNEPGRSVVDIGNRQKER